MEGFYPNHEWDMYPQIYHCTNKVRHEAHAWIPSFAEDDKTAPDFICGGIPRTVIDIQEARDRH